MMNAKCGMMNDERHAASHSSFRIPHSSFLTSLADGGGDCLRVSGRDALVFAQCVAQSLGGQLAQAVVEFGRLVYEKQRALGRLVVDAVEAVNAEAARLFVFGLPENFGGGACRARVGPLARITDEAEAAAHVLHVPDHLDERR